MPVVGAELAAGDGIAALGHRVQIDRRRESGAVGAMLAMNQQGLGQARHQHGQSFRLGDVQSSGADGIVHQPDAERCGRAFLLLVPGPALLIAQVQDRAHAMVLLVARQGLRGGLARPVKLARDDLMEVAQELLNPRMGGEQENDQGQAERATFEQLEHGHRSGEREPFAYDTTAGFG